MAGTTPGDDTCNMYVCPYYLLLSMQAVPCSAMYSTAMNVNHTTYTMYVSCTTMYVSRTKLYSIPCTNLYLRAIAA